jgi:archaeal flagellar protein FlaJ
VLIRTGVIAGRTGTAATPWDLSVIFLGIVGTLVLGLYAAWRLPALYARAKSVSADARIASWEFGTLSATAPLSTLLAVVAFLAWSGVAPFLALPADAITPLVIAALALLVATAPLAYFDYLRLRHVRALESRFPDFLRDLNESHASGMTMAQAIRVAARGDYGKLNGEIRRMAHQVSWGAAFPDALRLFGERVGTPLVQRAVALINKATAAGGNVKDVLAAAARDAREIEALEADRRSGMALYVIVIYVAFAVFLGVVAALQGLLVPSLLQSTAAVGGGSLAGLQVGGRMGLDDFRFLYFGVGLVQAIGSGIVAGVMSEGCLGAGLKHSAILVALTILSLGILL